MNISGHIAILLFCSCTAPLAPFAYSQGSLTPPGAPAPTMKRLDEVEPRHNLQATPVPAGVATSDPNWHFVINQPGSYYLSANLDVTRPNGIRIDVEGVTVDLNGFTVSRASGSGGFGIAIVETAHGTRIQNGFLRGFARGIHSSEVGFDGSARGCSFYNLAVSGCTSSGIVAGEAAVLKSCRAYRNSGSSGITAGDGSILSDCAAYDNTTSTGISVGSESTLLNCNASSNRGTSVPSAGIRTSTGCSIVSCVASGNGTSLATGSATTGGGFIVGAGSTIQGCTASFNGGGGFTILSETTVRDNTSTSNGTGSNREGAGIRVTGRGNRIEGNNVANNDRGLEVLAPDNFISRNTARGNTTANWEIVAGNVALVLQAAAAAAINGDSGGVSPGSTNPNANYTY